MNAPTPSPLDQHRRRNRVEIVESSAAPAEPKAKAVKGKKKAVKTEGEALVAAPRKVRRALSKADEELLNGLLAQEQDFIDSPAFYEEEANEKIYDQAPEIPKPDTSWYHPVMDDLSGRTRTIKTAQQVILTGAGKGPLPPVQLRALQDLDDPARRVGDALAQAHARAGRRDPALVPQERPDPRADRQHQPRAGAGDG
ncbi:MAG: hypothetical protein QM783_04610 [Phycisphaerales bacterium]